MTTPDGGGGPGDEPGYPNERYAGFDAEQDTGDYTHPLGGRAPAGGAPGGAAVPGGEAPRGGAPAGAGGWGGVEDVGVDDLMAQSDPDLPNQRRHRRGWKAPTIGRGVARPRADAYPEGDPTGSYPPDPRAAGGYPASGYPEDGYPAGSQPSAGYPAGAAASGGYPAGAQPVEGYPAGSQPSGAYPAEGYPAGAQTAEGYPAQGRAAGGYPTGGPSDGYPPQGQPTDGYPPQNQPTDDYPPQSRPIGGYPAQGRPADAPRTRASSGRAQPTQATAAFGRRVGDGVGWVRERAAGGITALRSRRAETPAASRRRGPGAEPAALRALPLAVGMFTVLPVPPSRAGRDAVDAGLAGWALRWLPVLGALLAVVGWAVSLIFWRGYGTGAGFVGAVAWVGLMAVLTRGLHLDGLADLADGLGSRRPAEEALAIMRRSDIGPFGVTAVVAALLLQLGGVLTIMGAASRAQGLVVLVVVAVTGRLAALDAARPSVPPARPGGFGALVTGTAPVAVRAGAVGATLVLGWLLLALTPTSLAHALWLPFAVLVGLVAGRLITWHAVRRLDGITGDVFGAVIEIATTATLLALAAIIAWGGI